MASELKPCPFCSKTMMLRSALWPSEGDADAIIHADPTDCPMPGFSDGSADGSIIEKWNCSLSNEDDFPSDGSCVRCGSVPRNANGLCNTCLDEDAERLENTRPTPVVPVSPDTTGKCGELVTVGYHIVGSTTAITKDKDLTARWMLGNPNSKIEDVVTRSQAVELLAAERAKLTKEEADHTRSLEERDRYHDVADKLAQAIADRYQSDIGEHSSVNDPWQNALNLIEADNAVLTAEISAISGHLDCEADSDSILHTIREIEADKAIYKESAEALEAKLAAAEKALEPFGVFGDETISPERRHFLQLLICPEGDEHPENYGPHFRKARAALGGKPS